MSIQSGCQISDVQAICALQNYASDITFECFPGPTFNSAFFARVSTIAWLSLTSVKSGLDLLSDIKPNWEIRKNSSDCLKILNFFLVVMGGLTILTSSITQNNPAWILSDWNAEITNCRHAQIARSDIVATLNPGCMANPSWNILESLNITCCFSQKLEERWKSTHTPLLPIILAVAGLGISFLMIIDDHVRNRNVQNPETLPFNTERVTTTPTAAPETLTRIFRAALRILLIGLALGTTIASFGYSYCQPAWVQEDFSTCVCSAPQH